MKKYLTFMLTLVFISDILRAQDLTNYDLCVAKINGEIATFRVENIQQMVYVERLNPNEGWTSLGYCIYGEDYIGSLTYDNERGDLCCDYYVEVQEKDDEPGLYHLVNPYSPDIYPYGNRITYDIDNDYYLEINACDPEGVYIKYQDTGLSIGNLGRIWVYSVASNFLDAGYSLKAVKLYVPKNTYGIYSSTDIWKDFFNIVELTPEGIEGVSAEDPEVMGYYTIDGKVMETPQRGVNIVKYSDGSTKKVLMK